MAKERWFTGFEAGQGADVTVIGAAFPSAVVCDGSARTGDFHYQVYKPVASSTNIRATKSFSGGPYTCAVDLTSVIARMQVAVQVIQLPNVDGASLLGFSIGTTVAPAQDMGVKLNANGTLSILGTTIPTTNGGYALTVNRQYIIRCEIRYTRNDAGADPLNANVWVYDADTMDAPTGPTLLSTFGFNGTASLSNYSLSGPPTLGGAVGTPTSRIVKYDDWWYSVADGADANLTTNTDLAWPTGSRIAPVPITSQVIAQWTGAVQLVQDIPNSAVAGNEQTSASAGLQSTFQHDRAVTLGLIPVGQLTPADVPDAPPFTGQSPPGNVWTNGNYTFEGGLPVPTLVSADPTSGAGLFQTGVWVSAATIRYYQPPGATPPTNFIGPRTTPVFINGSSFGNYAIDATAAMAAGLPDDGFTIPGNVNSAYNRYGIIFFVFSGFNAAGQWDAFTNLTNLQTINGMPLVAVYAAAVNKSVPYSNTHPENRPLTQTVRFLGGDYTQLTADLGGPITGGGGTAGGVLQFYQVGSATPPATHLPVCAAIKVYATIKRTAGSGTDQILINGVATNVPSGVTYPSSNSSQYAFDWAEKTADEFDAFTFGFQSGSAAATQAGNCLAEVMTAGPTVKRSNPYGKYLQKVGIYTSNNSFQEIPVGFKPSVVIVKRIGATAAVGSFKAWWMGGTTSWPLTDATSYPPESIAIMQLTDNGFLVGPANNANGVAATYAYIAIRDGEQDVVNGTYLLTGSYFRDSAADPLTVPLGIPLAFITSWTPTAGFVFGVGATHVKTTETAGTNSLQLGAAAAPTTDCITGFGVNSFTIGTNVRVAQAGQYPYMMLREDAGNLLASVFAHGSFAGTGGVKVVATPFAPEFVALDIQNGIYGSHWRSASGAGGANSILWVGGNGVVNNITAQGALDFTVGASASIVGQTSYWFIFKGEGTFGNEGGPNPDDVIPPDGGGGGGDTDATICSGGGLPLFPPTIGGHGCTKC